MINAMKLILITLVALVVGLMVGCSSEPAAPAATAAPTATPPPAYSDDEVLGAVRGHLMALGMSPLCTVVAHQLAGTGTVHQDPSNPDKYLVTGGIVDSRQDSKTIPGGKWTFIGSLAKVISTSTGVIGLQGC